MFSKPSFECFCGKNGHLMNTITEPFSFTMNNLVKRLINLNLYPQFSVNSFIYKNDGTQGFVFILSDDGLVRSLVDVHGDYYEDDVRCVIKFRGNKLWPKELERAIEDLEYIFQIDLEPKEAVKRRVESYNIDAFQEANEAKRPREDDEEEEENFHLSIDREIKTAKEEAQEVINSEIQEVINGPPAQFYYSTDEEDKQVGQFYIASDDD